MVQPQGTIVDAGFYFLLGYVVSLAINRYPRFILFSTLVHTLRISEAIDTSLVPQR